MSADRHRGEWRLAWLAAFQFLTRLPISISLPPSLTLFRRSTVFFPLVGLVIGAMIAGAGYGLGFILPFYVNAVLVLVLWLLISGGLHLDGLMDTADGLLSHRSRERMLEIMKDSHVGAMGVMACVLYLLLKAVLLAALLAEGGLERFFLLAVIPVWSRAYMVMAIAGWPYARSRGGLGSMYQEVRGQHAFLAGLVAAGFTLAAFVLMPGSQGITKVLVLLSGIMLITYAAGSWLASAISRKLGGLTGDVYGALNELTEFLLLLAVTVYLM